MDNFTYLFNGLSIVTRIASKESIEEVKVLKNGRNQIIIIPTISDWSISFHINKDAIEETVVKIGEDALFIRNMGKYGNISILRDLDKEEVIMRCAKILDYILNR